MYKDYKAVVNNEPYLSGYWGGGLKTMTEQAAEMFIPTFQLEIPLKMRAHLFKEEATSKAFLNAIVEIYNEVIVPWWPVKSVPSRFCKESVA